MDNITLVPENTSVDVDELHVSEEGHLQLVKTNHSLTSFNHFQDNSPVTLANVPHRYSHQKLNAGSEGEKAVIDVFLNAGVNGENVLKSHLFRTLNGEEELWDGVITLPGLSIVLQVKTRLNGFENLNRSRNWVSQSSAAIHHQVRKTMLDWQNCVPWYESFNTYSGTKKVLPYKSVPCIYLGVLAVNDLFPAEPSKYYSNRRKIKELPVPGFVVTLKELKLIFELLPLEEAIKYLIHRSNGPDWHVGYEIAHLFPYMVDNQLTSSNEITVT